MQQTLLTMILLAPMLAPAQGTGSAAVRSGEVRVAAEDDTRCRKEVKDYHEAMRFVRESAGNQIGNRVAQSYVSEDVLERTVATQGYCAAAQLLKSRPGAR
ncbi:MAG: hypothetical protein ACRC2X_01990 [Giesbergeria sp.]